MIGGKVLGISDIVKRMDPNGKPARLVNKLRQKNGIVDDMRWKEGNLPDGNRTSLIIGEPTIYKRRVNQGVPSSKSTTEQVEDVCAILEGHSEVDVKLIKRNGRAYREQEDDAFLRAMQKELARLDFYGSEAVDPGEFNGFATRISSTSGNGKQSIVTVDSTIGGGGAGSDNTSIWLIGWGDYVHGLYPEGGTFGLEHIDRGVEMVHQETTTGGRKLLAEVSVFMWDVGIAVRDSDFVQRIPNIDVSNLITKSSAANLIELMIRAQYQVPDLDDCYPVFYCNRTVAQMLHIQALDRTQNTLTVQTVAGKPVTFFNEIPVRVCDKITNGESVVA